MSEVVLDTHVLIWLMNGDRRLGAESRSLIASAAERSELSFSAISAWEIAMLVSKGRLTFDRDVLQWLRDVRRLPGLDMIPLSMTISVDSTRLPEGLHGDPADRLIVATARDRGAILVTADRALIVYAATGHVRVRPAGD